MVPDAPRFRKVAGSALACRRGSLEIFTTPSLAIHGALAYLAYMNWRRVVSGALTLMAVQYAALGSGPVCVSDQSTAAADASSHATHDAPGTSAPAVPCAPGPRNPAHSHSSGGCLAMAGCAACGVVSVVILGIAGGQFFTLPPIQTLSAPLSVLIPPDTPPPIA